ncbi:hypothetical protein JYU34_009864 [Plutella xylostella]|uniref:Uncharacterized protein n=1 Tax=Plutella xylostella TaxID=51655 RepID=A0ABQ7QKH8_PLUXY|nr:hypothetical protein JYU34_009864 [Plutella xylostella]
MGRCVPRVGSQPPMLAGLIRKLLSTTEVRRLYDMKIRNGGCVRVWGRRSAPPSRPAAPRGPWGRVQR